MPKKVVARIELIRLASTTQRIGFVPAQVRPGGTLTSGRFRNCERTVVLTAKAFEKRGLEVLLDLLGRAPLDEHDPFDGYTTVATERVWDGATPSAKVSAYVEGGEVTRVRISPAKRSYLSGEVLMFKRIEPARFLEEIERLLPKR